MELLCVAVMAWPTELSFENTPSTGFNVESLTLFGSSFGMGDEPLTVELQIVSDDGGSSPFAFMDMINHCETPEDGWGDTCVVLMEHGLAPPVIPIVYHPFQNEGGNTFDVGWIRVSWYEGETKCEGPVIMLDGEVAP